MAGLLHPIVISPQGVGAVDGLAVSPRTVHTGDVPAITATQGTDTTPVVTETYIAEIRVPATMDVSGIAILNGSAVAGNVTLALADSNGNQVSGAVTASTAQAGTAGYQKIPFARAVKVFGPATYYVQAQFDSTSARFRSHAVGVFGAGKLTSQTYGTLPGFTVPTTFTASLGPVASLY